jgi:hypothetical protein
MDRFADINAGALRRNIVDMEKQIEALLSDPASRTKLPYYMGGSRERALQIETLEAIGCRPVYGSTATGDPGALYALRQTTTALVEARERNIVETRKHIARVQALLAPISAAQFDTITDAAA